jgi:hypothetical protein
MTNKTSRLVIATSVCVSGTCRQQMSRPPETRDERPAHWLHYDIGVQRPPQQLRIALVDGRHLCTRSRAVSDPSSLRIWCQERLTT